MQPQEDELPHHEVKRSEEIEGIGIDSRSRLVCGEDAVLSNLETVENWSHDDDKVSLTGKSGYDSASPSTCVACAAACGSCPSVRSGEKRNPEEEFRDEHEETKTERNQIENGNPVMSLLGGRLSGKDVHADKKSRKDLPSFVSSRADVTEEFDTIAGDAAGAPHESDFDHDYFGCCQEYHWDINVEDILDSNGSKCISHAEICPQDVLFGRGGFTIHHQGNVHYRKLVRERVHCYMNNAKKRDKTSLSEAVVRAILCSGGRFLKKDQGGELRFGTGASTGKLDIGHKSECTKHETSGSNEISGCYWVVLNVSQARKKVSQRFREEAALMAESGMNSWRERKQKGISKRRLQNACSNTLRNQKARSPSFCT